MFANKKVSQFKAAVSSSGGFVSNKAIKPDLLAAREREFKESKNKTLFKLLFIKKVLLIKFV